MWAKFQNFLGRYVFNEYAKSRNYFGDRRTKLAKFYKDVEDADIDAELAITISELLKCLISEKYLSQIFSYKREKA